MIGQAGKQRLQRIEHDALCLDGIDGVAEPDEEAFEVVFTGLLDLASLDMNMIEINEFFRYQVVKVKAERADILLQFFLVFLEHHENAGLAKFQSSANDKFGAEHRLSRTGAAADKRRPSDRKAAEGYLVQPFYAGQCFL